MEKIQILQRIHEMEEELAALKQYLQPPKPRRGLWFLRKAPKFLLTYWPLLSVIAALLIALYVKIEFGVDYFYEYRAISTTQKLTEFQSQLGDTLLARSEWKAAEEAYWDAYEIDKNNVAATKGILLAQVFQPASGEKYYVPEVVDAKLDYLEENFPDDYQVSFLRGVYYLNQGNYSEAREYYTKALQLKPDFVSGYINRGYASQGSFDLLGAIQDYKKAIDLAPDDSNANNNIGFCYMLLLDFKDAISHYQTAVRSSPKLITYINLGDAYLFSGDAESALSWYQLAARIVEVGDVENERFAQGEWTFNYMPLQKNDTTTIKSYVRVVDMSQKNVLLHYGLSFGHALNGDFDAASREFDRANQLDTHKDYNLFFAYRIRSLENLLSLSGTTRQWFDSHLNVLVAK